MIIKNPFLDALIVFVLTFAVSYLTRFLLNSGNYSFTDNWITNFFLAFGFTIGLSVIPSIYRKTKANNVEV